VRVKSGGRIRVEPGGDAFIRTICKLTHIGPKQYAKGDGLCFVFHLYLLFLIVPLTLGDGLPFRDFLAEKYPNLKNQCVGRAEFSKRY
jgi:hypothetical protein